MTIARFLLLMLLTESCGGCLGETKKALDFETVDVCRAENSLAASSSTVVEHRLRIDWSALLITDPNGKHFYFRRSERSNRSLVISDDGSSVNMTVGELLGAKSLSDDHKSRDVVFVAPGKYTLYFADNVETERENARWCEYFLDFQAIRGD